MRHGSRNRNGLILLILYYLFTGSSTVASTFDAKWLAVGLLMLLKKITFIRPYAGKFDT